jgi:hypothetical protein
MKRLDAREAELTARLKADQAELEELRVTRRYLERLAGEDEKDEDNAEGDDPQDAPASGSVLTIGQLAMALLHNAEPEGLTSNEILDRLQRGPAPDLVRTSLSPPLSRLKKRGEIVLVGDRWRIAPGTEVPFD